MRTTTHMTGAVRIAQARVGTLDDNPAVWPPEIWLSGFTYHTIRHRTGGLPVAERSAWISRGPVEYRPQPYEQLADYYRRAGHDDDVRRVLLAKQRHRRTTLTATGRIAGRILDATVGYGYQPWMAALWLALLLTTGTTVYAIAPPHPYQADRYRPSTRLRTPSICSSRLAPSGSALPAHPRAARNGFPMC